MSLPKINKNEKTQSALKKRPFPPVAVLACIQGVLLFLALIFGSLKSDFISAAFLCVLFMSLYYEVILWAFCKKENIQQVKQSVSKSGKQIIILAVLLTAITAWLIMQERFIYYWDYSGYWIRNVVVAQQLFRDPFGALKIILSSVNTDEYNYLLSLLMALPTKLFGDSYVVYIIIVFVMFVLPAVILISLLVDKFCGVCGIKRLTLWQTMIFVSCISCITVPCLEGFPDAASPLCIAALMYLVCDWKWDRFNFFDCSLVIILLFLVMLQRRYFAFFVVGFVFGWGIYALLCLLQSKNKKNCFKYIAATMGYIGAVSLALLLTVFKGFFKMSAGVNYAEKYSAYAMGSLSKNVLSCLRYYGWIFVALAVVAIVYIVLHAVAKKQYEGIPALGLMAVVIVMSMLPFVSVQSMGKQHQYIIVVPMTVLIVTAVAILAGVADKKAGRITVVSLCAVLMLVNSSVALSIVDIKRPAGFSKMTYTPKVRNDIDVLHQLNDRLIELTEENNIYSYILSSSDILNDDIMDMLYFPETNEVNLPAHAHVDLRDGFATTSLKSKYVVVCDPVQTHLKEGSQSIISIPAKEILEGTGIGKHYEFVEEYQLDRNVKAKIYKRINKIPDDDLEELALKFDELYPGKEKLFRDRIMKAG